MSTMLPRRFALVRRLDYNGGPDVGVVAFGIAFSDGRIVLRWCSAHPATSSWDSLDDLLAAHGHEEGASIQWIDPPTTESTDLSPATSPGRRARRRAAMTEGVSGPAVATVITDPPANGSRRPPDSAENPAGEKAIPSPSHTPGRHRRANQLEQPV